MELRRTLRSVLAPLAVTMLVTGACGTRVHREDIESASPQMNADPGQSSLIPSDVQSPAGQGTPASIGASAPASGVPASGASSGRTPATATGTKPNAATASNPKGGASPGEVTTPGSPGSAALPGPATPAPIQGRESTPGTKTGTSPILLASAGSYSGVLGTIMSPMLDGARVWIKRTNERGGLNGHPLRLYVYDDAGDPARHRAQVQEAIEKKHVVAFLMNGEGITGGPSVQYIDSKGVPVIGISTGESWANQSRMTFPQASSGPALYNTWLPAYSEYWIPQGLTKLATVVCTEAQACTDTEKLFTQDAAKFGFNYVYKTRSSLAQPDFTAECLAARNAGAQVMFIALDQNSMVRFANSCARQGFRPKLGTTAQVVVDRFKDEPNLDGFASPSPVSPYFQSGTPWTDEFRAALKENNVPLSGGAVTGWTAGKLLERAAARVPVPEPPTTAALLAGLWSIKQDNLGGLTAPLTFIKNQPAPPVSCWYMTVVKDGIWASPDGFKLKCRS